MHPSNCNCNTIQWEFIKNALPNYSDSLTLNWAQHRNNRSFRMASRNRLLESKISWWKRNARSSQSKEAVPSARKSIRSNLYRSSGIQLHTLPHWIGLSVRFFPFPKVPIVPLMLSYSNWPACLSMRMDNKPQLLIIRPPHSHSSDGRTSHLPFGQRRRHHYGNQFMCKCERPHCIISCWNAKMFAYVRF